MTFEEQIELIQKLSLNTAEKVDAIMAATDRRVIALQKDFLLLFLDEIVGKLKERGGKVAMTKQNMGVIAKIDKFFSLFLDKFFLSEISKVAADMLKVADLTREYYEATGYAEKKLEQISRSMTAVDEAIGVSSNQLIPGGYLDRLAKTDLLKHQLRTQVVAMANGGMGLAQYTKEIQRLVLGNKDADGLLQSYYRQYVYDSYNQVHEIANKAFADGLELKHFIYTGSLIDTSRPFCEKRAGKAFSIEETKKWKDDPDLIDKKTKAAYNPIIERGRYNCRHYIKWISEDLYYHMRPDKKRA